jgi:hypothetical protein
VGGDMVLKKVWYYRIGYDRTALSIANPNIHFEDGLTFELINSLTVQPDYSNWASETGFRWNYRNFLMGTNGINMGYSG